MTSSQSFDAVIDRSGTNAVKWDYRRTNTKGEPIHPMWVADMDFPAPEAVRRALAERAEHPVYGYTFAPQDYRDAFLSWQRERNGLEIDEGWLVFAPAVMPAVRAAILAFSEPGDEVVVQPPVYFPFFHAIRDNGRQILENPLAESRSPDGTVRYEMDLDRLRAAITPRTKVLLLCSPHNPVGRVWSRSELAALAELCVEHDLVVVSDEIHSDIRRADVEYAPFIGLGPEAAARTIATYSPSKTFNVAGLASSHIVVPDASLRDRFTATLKRLGMTLPNLMSVEASRAAFAEGGHWADALLRYLDEQIAWFTSELARRFGERWKIGMSPIEGTYLAWLDTRAFLAASGAAHDDLKHALLEEAALWLSEGGQFGTGGEGFFRMNLATPRANVEEGLRRLERALAFVESRA